MKPRFSPERPTEAPRRHRPLGPEPVVRRVLSPREVAVVLNICRAGVYNLIHRGALGRPVRVGTHLRISLAAPGRDDPRRDRLRRAPRLLALATARPPPWVRRRVRVDITSKTSSRC